MTHLCAGYGKLRSIESRLLFLLFLFLDFHRPAEPFGIIGCQTASTAEAFRFANEPAVSLRILFRHTLFEQFAHLIHNEYPHRYSY